MTEPTTLLTDYLLGGLAAVLAWRLVSDEVRLKPDIRTQSKAQNGGSDVGVRARGSGDSQLCWRHLPRLYRRTGRLDGADVVEADDASAWA